MIKKFFIILFLFGIVFNSCDLFNFNNLQKAPELPNSDSFNFRASVLDNDTVQAEVKKNLFLNWFYSAQKISLWRNFINDNAEIAIELLQNAYTYNNFSYYANNTWLCEYSVLKNTDNYKVKFFATYNADSSVVWEMYSTKNGNTELLTLTGESNYNKTQGNWVFYKLNQNSSPILKIDWLITDNSFCNSFYNIDNLSFFQGSNINFEYVDTSDYNLYVNIFNSKYDTHSQIRLNTNNYIGGINAPLIYQDSLWHCWNYDLTDIDCKEIN